MISYPKTTITVQPTRNVTYINQLLIIATIQVPRTHA